MIGFIFPVIFILAALYSARQADVASKTLYDTPSINYNFGDNECYTLPIVNQHNLLWAHRSDLCCAVKYYNPFCDFDKCMYHQRKAKINTKEVMLKICDLYDNYIKRQLLFKKIGHVDKCEQINRLCREDIRKGNLIKN